MNNRLAGHELLNEGAPFKMNPARRGQYIRIRTNGGGVSGIGRAVCSCGVVSDHLPSANRRKAWHREHKAAVARGELIR